eukprot:5706849-Pyramimonas_sp.AAC.1
MGPRITFVIRAGHPRTCGPLRPEYGGSIRREPRLRVNCGEVSGGSHVPMGPAHHLCNPSGSSSNL